MTSIVVISAGLSEESSTRMLADRLAAVTRRRLESGGASVELTVVELRPLAHAIMDAMLTGFASGELADAIEAVRRADAMIAVTPVFTASYSGLFKSFFDILEMDTLKGMPVLLGATAGTARHSLVLDHALRPLFAYLKAIALPTAVFAASEDWGDVRAGALEDRISRAGTELADQLLGGVASRSARPAATDPFDPDSVDFADFESLLNS
jgi:FMN reductase